MNYKTSYVCVIVGFSWICTQIIELLKQELFKTHLFSDKVIIKDIAYNTKYWYNNK